MLTDEQFEAVHKAWYECGIDLLGGEWSKFAAKISAAPAAQPEPSQAVLDAFDRIDRFLRNSMDDECYADFAFDLELVFSRGIKEQP